MLNPTDDNIFVILPVFNEEPGLIGQIVSGLLQQGYRVVLVDDASAKKVMLPPANHLFQLRHAVNLGQGAALQTGIALALKKNADYLVTFDADGQHSIADIPALLLPLREKKADITLGSRFLLPGHHNASWFRQLLLEAGRWVNYFFTGFYLSDAHNGLRAMNRYAAEKINLKENRMAHATEFLLQIKQHKLRMLEVPATVTYTDYSKGKGQSAFNSLRIFFDLFLHKLFE
ncbi:MAG: glycosyltransferase family 2 protein [Sphingobacteriales bacterium]|nr:glycosyltransferase family 2 protein [Sphingobacteriales bacterium]